MNYEAVILSASMTGLAVLVRMLVERSCRSRLPSGRAWVALVVGQLVAALMMELAMRDDAHLRYWCVFLKASQGVAFQVTLWRVSSHVEGMEGALLGCLAAYASHHLTGKALRPLLLT